MYKIILVLLTLSLTSCFTNRAGNRELNEKIFAKYLAKRPMMGQPGPVCSTCCTTSTK
jgi:hypothetical protein